MRYLPEAGIAEAAVKAIADLADNYFMFRDM